MKRNLKLNEDEKMASHLPDTSEVLLRVTCIARHVSIRKEKKVSYQLLKLPAK